LLLYSARSPEIQGIKLLRSPSRFVLLTASLLSVAAVMASHSRAAESDSASNDSQEEIVERILELRSQIEDLLEILPADVREEVERRWQERHTEDPELESSLETLTDPVPTPEQEREIVDESEAEPDLEPIAEEVVVETAPPCGGFHLFDTNEDSLVSGGDRPWRFLRLWFDSNGDSRIDESEIETPFDLGVRQIDVGLRFYGNEEGDSEDLDVDDFIWLRQVGKGKANRRSGALVVAAERLARDGRLGLVDADGTQLSGYQPLGSTSFLETSDGERFPVFCPESE